MKPTRESLERLRAISETVPTWHHHHHILLDLADQHFTGRVRYVELGCYAGASSCLLASRPNTAVTAVDTMDLIPEATVRENVRRWNANGNPFDYVRGITWEARTVAEVQKGGPIDLLFIDADHEYSAVMRDFYAYAPLVRPGGFCVFDDYRDPVFHDVRDAVADLFAAVSGWETWGTVANTLGARGFHQGDEAGNCYIARRIS